MVRAADGALLKPASAGTAETSLGQSPSDAPATDASADLSPFFSDPKKLAEMLALESAGPSRSIFDPRKSSEVENPKAKEYQRLAQQWLAEYKKDPTNQDALIQIGKAYFGLGKFDKTILAYDAFLKAHPRDLKALQLRAETCVEIVKVLKSGEATAPAHTKAEIQALTQEFENKFKADQAMSIALNAVEVKKQFQALEMEISKFQGTAAVEKNSMCQVIETLAMQFLQLGGATYPNPRDAEFVRKELNSLAATAHGILARSAKADNDPKIQTMAVVYQAREALALGKVEAAEKLLRPHYQAGLEKLGKGNVENGFSVFWENRNQAEELARQGKTAEAQKIFAEIPAGLIEAADFLQKFDNDRLAAVNLVVLEAMERNLAEEEAVQDGSDHSLLGFAHGVINSLGRDDAKTIHDDTREAFALKREVLAEVRKLLEEGKAHSIKDALTIIQSEGAESFRPYAGELLAAAGDQEKRGTDIVAALLDYSSEWPPQDQKAKGLVKIAGDYVQRDLRQGAASIVGLLIPRCSQDPEIKKSAEALQNISQTKKGIGDAVVALWKGTQLSDLVIELVALKGAGTLARIAELKTLLQLQKAGMAANRVRQIGLATRISVMQNALFTFHTVKDAMTHDVRQVFTREHLALSYASTVLMVIGCELGGEVGMVAGPRFARGLKLVAKGGAELSRGGQVVSWATRHAFSLGGMIGSSQVSQRLPGQTPMAWQESLVHDVYYYVLYAAAQSPLSRLPGRIGAAEKQLHHDLARVKAELSAEGQMKRLGYDKIPSEGKDFELFSQLRDLAMSRPGFNGDKLTKLIARGQHGAARNYPKGFALKPVLDGDRIVGFEALSLHEQLGVEAPKASPRNFAKLLRGLRQILRQVAMQPALWMLGIPGEGPMGTGRAKATGTALTFPGGHEAAYQKFKADSATYRSSETEDLGMRMREKRDDANYGSYSESAQQRLYDEAEAMYHELLRRDAVKEAEGLPLDQLREKVAKARENLADYLVEWEDYSQSSAFEARAKLEALEEILTERLAAEAPPIPPPTTAGRAFGELGEKITFDSQDEAEYQRLKETSAARYSSWDSQLLSDATANLTENGSFAEALPMYLELGRRRELESIQSQGEIEKRVQGLREKLQGYLDGGSETPRFLVFQTRSRIEVLEGLLDELRLGDAPVRAENYPKLEDVQNERNGTAVESDTQRVLQKRTSEDRAKSDASPPEDHGDKGEGGSSQSLGVFAGFGLVDGVMKLFGVEASSPLDYLPHVDFGNPYHLAGMGVAAVASVLGLRTLVGKTNRSFFKEQADLARGHIETAIDALEKHGKFEAREENEEIRRILLARGVMVEGEVLRYPDGARFDGKRAAKKAFEEAKKEIRKAMLGMGPRDYDLKALEGLVLAEIHLFKKLDYSDPLWTAQANADVAEGLLRLGYKEDAERFFNEADVLREPFCYNLSEAQWKHRQYVKGKIDDIHISSIGHAVSAATLLLRISKLGKIEALGRHGAKEAIDDLRAALKDEDFFVRWAAVTALRRLGAVEATEDLRALLNNEKNPILKKLLTDAADAIKELEARKALPVPPVRIVPKVAVEIPASNQVDATDLAELQKMPMRLVVREIIDHADLQPRSKVTAGDFTFYFSPIIYVGDKAGDPRPYVLALVPVQENGTTVLKRRFFYKSNSEGGWRASPYMTQGRLAKGVGLHYTQETQPVPEIASHLQLLEGGPALYTSKREFEKFVALERADASAQISMQNGFGDEIDFADPIGLTKAGELQPGMAFEGFDPRMAGRLASLPYPEGFIPDFTQSSVRVYTQEHALLGTITCSEYAGGFLVNKASGERQEVIWTMAQDGEGRAWVKSIRFKDVAVNSYGVFSEVIDSGIITSKPLEYENHARGLPRELKKPFNHDYVDITPALALLKPIREFRAAKKN